MRLYFAGGESSNYVEMRINSGVDILMSYHYLKKRNLREELKGFTGNFFLDSGAFTAYQSGNPINIDEYCDFIIENRDIITVYANLDDIKDPEVTLKNQKYMESRGLKPLPCFHYGEDLKYLDYYVDNYEYIALGGLVLVALQRKKMEKFVDKSFARIMERTLKQGKPLTKVHGFGVSADWALKRYPWYTCDSTAWLSYGRYGRSKFEKDPKQELFKAKTVHYLELIRETLVGYQREVKEVTRLWAKRGITWDE